MPTSLQSHDFIAKIRGTNRLSNRCLVQPRRLPLFGQSNAQLPLAHPRIVFDVDDANLCRQISLALFDGLFDVLNTLVIGEDLVLDRCAAGSH